LVGGLLNIIRVFAPGSYNSLYILRYSLEPFLGREKMSSEFFAIILMLGVLGIVTIAWRIRAECDKNKVVPTRKPGLSEAGKRRQMQATIDRLERRQAEVSRKLDQVLTAKPKAVKKAAPKTTKTRTRKTASKAKTKK
jgi:hypothetical protein